jgi:hypothetical protein
LDKAYVSHDILRDVFLCHMPDGEQREYAFIPTYHVHDGMIDIAMLGNEYVCEGHIFRDGKFRLDGNYEWKDVSRWNAKPSVLHARPAADADALKKAVDKFMEDNPDD